MGSGAGDFVTFYVSCLLGGLEIKGMGLSELKRMK